MTIKLTNQEVKDILLKAVAGKYREAFLEGTDFEGETYGEISQKKDAFMENIDSEIQFISFVGDGCHEFFIK